MQNVCSGPFLTRNCFFFFFNVRASNEYIKALLLCWCCSLDFLFLILYKQAKSLQAKSPNRSILLNPIPYGEGSNTTPAPPSPLTSEFFSVRVTTSIFSDFNLHSLRNFWPIFENAASTQTLLHLGWEKKHECQKLPKNESNKYGRQEEGLIMLGIFLCSKVLYHPGLLTCNASSQAFMVQEITRGYIDGNRTILSRVNVDIFFIHVSKIRGLFKRKINTKIN